jgi:endonuclease VIII
MRIGLGAALLDQRVMAGVGNVYRAEALFAQGIDPRRPATTLTRDDEFDRLWETITRMLGQGV